MVVWNMVDYITIIKMGALYNGWMEYGRLHHNNQDGSFV